MLPALRLTITAAICAILAPAQTTILLNAAANIAVGQPGLSNVIVTGSGFPAGTIAPAQVTVVLTPAPGSVGPTVQTTASAVTTVIGSTRRVAFQIPASLQITTPLPYRITLAGSIVRTPTTFSALTINPAASLTAVNPAGGSPGTSLAVTLAAAYSNFLQGVTTASFGAGITVNTVTVSSPTSLSVSLTIAPTAAAGLRGITVTTNSQTLTLTSGFSVLPANSLTLNPSSGLQQQTISVSIAGLNTAFSQGSTVLDFGAGIVVNTLTVTGPTTLTANVTIQPDAAAGQRTVTATTGTQVATLPNGFTVTLTPVSITAVSPNAASPGQAVNVTVSGLATHFVQNATQLTAGANIVVSNLTVTSPTRLTATLTIAAGASIGARAVIVTTGTEVVTLANGFFVSGTPVLSSISPNYGLQGQTTANITVAGVYTNFQQGSTVVSLGTGITISNVVVVSPTQLSFTAFIPLTVPTSPVAVTVTTGGQAVTRASFFNVLGATGALPGTVRQPGGTPAPGASVRLYNGNLSGGLGGALAAGKAAADGTFALPRVGAGSNIVLFALDQEPNPTSIGWFAGSLAVMTGPADLTLNGSGQLTVRVFSPSGVLSPDAKVLLRPNYAFIPSDLQNGLLKEQNTGASGETVFSQAYAGSLVVEAQDAVGQTFATATASVTNGGSSTVDLYLKLPESASQIASIWNGPPIGNLLPAGLNEGASAVASLFNGALGTTLPAGRNEGISPVASLYNGAVSNSLPAGFNEGVSKIIAAQITSAGGALNQLQLQSRTGGDNEGSTMPGTNAVQASPLMAGQTLTLESEYPAPFYINGIIAGNDASAPNRFTFVVPQEQAAISVRAGSSAETLLTIAPSTTAPLHGQLLDESDMPFSAAIVKARHQGLRAEFFDLEGRNIVATEPSSLDGIQPVADIPVSSLNFWNPDGVFQQFPVGPKLKANFAVRLRGEFHAAAKGEYQFALAASEGASLSLDGKLVSRVENIRPGVESPVTLELGAGWHSIEILLWRSVGPGELVVTFAAPDGSARQPIPAGLLRAESPGLAVKPARDGKFTIFAPAWMQRVEAIVETEIRGEKGTATAPSRDGGFGQIRPVRKTQDQ